MEMLKMNGNNEIGKYEIKPDAITSFKGREFAFLSNMNMSYFDDGLEYNGYTFNSVETAFHAQKDPSKAGMFSEIIRPDFARKKGKSLKSVRKDWDEVKEGIMYDLVKKKFFENPKYREKLLATGDRQLVEGNTWNDRFWGVCDGVGLNKLGEILMKVRKELREEGLDNGA